MKILALRATTWDEFLHQMENAKKHLDAKRPKVFRGDEFWFRGHAQESWTLTPSLLRSPRWTSGSLSVLNSVESSLFWEFRARAHELNEKCSLDWDYLCHMRHHGVNTRLLDWTEVLAVAVYFAIGGLAGVKSGKPPAEACSIWMLDPYSLNSREESWDAREIIEPRMILECCDDYDYGDMLDDGAVMWEDPVAIYPKQINARMRAQRGWFTVHGTDIRSLDAIAPECVANVSMEPKAISEAAEFLATAGIAHGILFPDLDGLARELNEKNGLA